MPLLRAWDATENGVLVQEFGVVRCNQTLGRFTCC